MKSIKSEKIPKYMVDSTKPLTPSNHRKTRMKMHSNVLAVKTIPAQHDHTSEPV